MTFTDRSGFPFNIEREEVKDTHSSYIGDGKFGTCIEYVRKLAGESINGTMVVKETVEEIERWLKDSDE